MAASGDGYQVRHAGMKSQAKELDHAGDDAGAIRQLLAGTPCYSQDALGGDDMGPAFSAYSSAWTAESRTIEDALHELADKVRGAKGAYGGADGLVRTQAQKVQVGTNPTPGAPPIGTNPVHGTNPVRDTAPVTTGPAYAERPSALTDY
ncbi:MULTISPECIES: WXG100 family type VII secretion target [Streptomyces]|uniref:ESX-1 secretion-associated protein n=1 Tax=Streptomyces xanthii TaxID=2768069 RepID=A0A7H1B6N8_9ACTN|nr:hypothetical protein [Streptomyces xanthii]QNS04393.1 hypothetical protein IAG42_12655 [Streptomyces xanthii]